MLRTAMYLSELKRNQWLPKKELEKIRLKRLKSIVNHAYSTVPYYRDLFKKHSLSPQDIKNIEDMEKIPITTKEDLIQNFPSRIISSATKIGDCTIEQTSGSSGLSLKVARDSHTKEYELALVMHALFECGLSLRDLMFVFEDPRNFGKEKTGLINKLGFLRKEKASVFADSGALLARIQKSVPDVIYGFPSTMVLIARLMEDKNISLKKTPKFMVSTSETLYPKFREKIEGQFKTNLFDHYGSTEFSRIAWQCPQKEFLHINSDSHIVEFLSDGLPVEEEQGLITVTSLYNYSMPLLRYSLNDVSESVSEECPCGRTHPLMKSIEGRQDDFVLDSKGRLISPKVLCYEFDEINGAKEYRVLQKKAGYATLFLVKGDEFKQDELNFALKNIAKHSHNSLKIRVVFKKSIPLEKKKLRRVVSCTLHPCP